MSSKIMPIAQAWPSSGQACLKTFSDQQTTSHAVQKKPLDRELG